MWDLTSITPTASLDTTLPQRYSNLSTETQKGPDTRTPGKEDCLSLSLTSQLFVASGLTDDLRGLSLGLDISDTR
jgi:hypothetical protein